MTYHVLPISGLALVGVIVSVEKAARTSVASASTGKSRTIMVVRSVLLVEIDSVSSDDDKDASMEFGAVPGGITGVVEAMRPL